MIEPHPFLQMYVDRMARPEIERHAALHGMTLEELSGAVRERLRGVLKDADLWLPVNPARLRIAFETGVIPNALQTAGERSFVRDWGIGGAIVEMLLNQRRDVLYHVQLKMSSAASRRWFSGLLPGFVFLRLDPALKTFSTFTEGGTSTNLSYTALFPDATYSVLMENKSWTFEMLTRMIQPGADTEALFSELLSHLTYDERVPPVRYFDSPPVLNSPIIDPHELSWSWGIRLASGGQTCPLCLDLKPDNFSKWDEKMEWMDLNRPGIPLGDYCRFVAQVPGLIPVSSVSEAFFGLNEHPDLQDMARQLGIAVRTG